MSVLPEPVYGREFSLVLTSRFIRWEDGEIYELGAPELRSNGFVGRAGTDEQTKEMLAAHMQKRHPSEPLARAIIHSPTLEMLVTLELDLTKPVIAPRLKRVQKITVYAADHKGIVWESVNYDEPERVMEQEGITALCMHKNSLYYGTVNGKVHNDRDSKPLQFDGSIQRLIGHRGTMYVACQNSSDNKISVYELGKNEPIGAGTGAFCFHNNSLKWAHDENILELFSNKDSLYAVMDDGVYLVPGNGAPERIALRKGMDYSMAGNTLFYVSSERAKARSTMPSSFHSGGGIIAFSKGKETRLFKGKRIKAYCIAEATEKVLA